MNRTLKKKPNTKSKSQISFDRGIAYTKAGKPVFILYLRNLPHLITEKDLRNYFSCFGNVKSVEIHEKGSNNRVYKYGLVHFEDASSAGAASQRRIHLICNRKVTARPASRQPGSDQNYRASFILSLNDDCLLHLCSHLSLNGQINLLKTCMRFSRIVEIVYRSKKALIISEEEPLTLRNLKQFLVIAGQHLRQVRFGKNSIVSSHSMRTLQLVAKMCSNLRELQMSNLGIVHPFVFNRVCLKLRYLTRLELINCNIDDDICQNLIPLRNVQSINFSFNQFISGKYLDQFPKLVHLNVHFCLKIRLYHIRRICQRGILKGLNIVGCPELNRGGLPEALLKLQKLEVLAFTHENKQTGINKISQLKSLRMLLISHLRDLNVNFIKALAENKSEKLYSLVLFQSNLDHEAVEHFSKFKNLSRLGIYGNRSLTDSFVQGLSNLKQLKELDLSHSEGFAPQSLIKLFEHPNEIRDLRIEGCKNVTNDIIFEIAKQIKTRGIKSRCTISARRTGISMDILKEERYKEYTPFVELTF